MSDPRLWLDRAYLRAFRRWLAGRPYRQADLERWRTPAGTYPIPPALDPTLRRRLP